MAINQLGDTFSYDPGTGVKANAQVVRSLGPLSVAVSATILSGQSLSSVIDLSEGRLARIHIPAAWTAANLTFQASSDGASFADLYDAYGAEYSVVVGGAARSIMVPLSDFIGIRYIKVRSGTSAAPVNQAADRTLTLSLVA